MKRFFVFVLLLACFVSTMGEATKEEKQECKCAEGEENCPCLAQAETAEQKGEQQKRPKVFTKKEIKQAKMQKKAARKEALLLKKALKKAKAQLRMLSKKIKLVPELKKKAMTEQKKAFLYTCKDLDQKIKVAVRKLAEMKRRYKYMCEVRSKAILKKTALKLKKYNALTQKLAKKASITRAAYKDASKKDKKVLKRKLKKIKKDIMVAKGKAKAYNKKLGKIKQMAVKIHAAKTKKMIMKKGMKASKIKAKMAKITKKIKKLKKKVKKVKAIRKNLKVRRSNLEPGHPKRIKYNVKISHLDNDYEKLMKKIKALSKYYVNLKACLKAKPPKPEKPEDCNELHEKLKKQLEEAIKIKEEFEKECLKVVIDNKKEIDDGKKELTEEQKKLYALELACKQATEEQREKLEKERLELQKRVDEIQLKLENSKKAYLLLRLKLEEDCNKALEKEKALTKEIVGGIEMRLKKAKKISDDLKEAINLSKKEAELKKQSAHLKIQQLSTNNKILKDKLRMKRSALRIKIKEIHTAKLIAKKDAEKLQKELEEESQRKISEERKKGKKKIDKLKNKAEELKKRIAALKIALDKEKDEKVRAALIKQIKEEEIKYTKLEMQLNILTLKIKTLKAELTVRQKAISDQQKEIALRMAKAKKLAAEREEKLIKIWREEEEKELKKELEILKKKYAIVKMKLKQIIAQKKIDWKSYQVVTEKEYINETNKQLRKNKDHYTGIINGLKKQISKAVAKLAQYKIVSAAVYDEKEKALKLKMAKHTEFEIQRMRKKVALEKRKQEAALKVEEAELDEKYNQQKEDLKAQIMKVKTRLAKIKSDALRKESVLKGKLNVILQDNDKLEHDLEYTSGQTKFKTEKSKERKKYVIKKNNDLIEEERIRGKAIVSKKQKALAKIKLDALKTEAILKVNLKSAQDEILNLKAILAKEKSKYISYNKKFASWKLQHAKEHELFMKGEQKKYDEKKKDLEASLKKCKELLATIEKEIRVLSTNLEEKLIQVKKIVSLEVKKKKMSRIVTSTVTKIRVISTELSMAEEKMFTTCTMDVKGSAQPVDCAILSAQTKKNKEDIAKLKSKVAEIKGTFDL